MDKKLLRKKLKGFIANCECYEQAEMISEHLGFKYDAGFYMNKGIPADHAWTHLKDGTIVDTTYSQFNPRIKIGIWKYGSKEYNNYISYERDYPKVLKLVKDKKLTWSRLGIEDKKDIQDVKKQYNWDSL